MKMLSRFCVLTAACVATLAWCAGSGATAPAADEFGTIKGRLVWGGPEAPKRAPIKADKNPEVCGKPPLYDPELVVDSASLGVANAFAFLPAPVGKNADAEKALLAAHPKVELDQKNCEFLPTSLAVHKDQTIVFKSSDAVGHNVHYIGFGNNANFALGPNGSAEKKLMAEKRAINLVCDIHPWMKGNLMVFNHPFFAVTAPDGSFEIKGVPPGKQKIVVWHRKVGFVTDGAATGLAVDVKAGEVTDLGEVKLDPAKVK
jgi:plastocyanin